MNFKNSGFYKLRFFISPEEFKSVLKLFDGKQAQFQLTNSARTEHDRSQVYEAYQTFYRHFATAEKGTGYYPHFVYSIAVTADKESSGFFARNEGVPFPYYGHYVYEDIRYHRPLTYTLFDEITGFIKKRTKPLRFSAHDADAMKEQKPSVRISPDAMQDLKGSWMFGKYGLVIHSR
jgi:hypothetical protein